MVKISRFRASLGKDPSKNDVLNALMELELQV